MKTLEEKIAVMQHYLNGGAITINNDGRVIKKEMFGDLNFNWGFDDYSIYEEPKSKPSIDWNHVSKEYQWLAVDEDGSAYLFVEEPEICKELKMWQNYMTGVARAEIFASFNPGNCDWKDSLVQRPK